ncbi:hypothetical protein B5M09_002916 [Aphanomyces astaci]|uniref:Uncharacterized protein n=1 Tax=Aphanomyces astaci TaxID=112090 RepID=A0A3R7YD78_APHAT|nr:hypothetical protein B5M09_002916 [Aphanomyces astaci]
MSTCFSGSALDQIKACFASNDSKQYLREYIAFTSTIDLPWTKVNDKVLGTPTSGVGYDLLTKSICDAYRSEPLVVEAVGSATTTTLAVPTGTPVAKTTQQAGKAKEKKPVMPCRQKEKGFVYEDPPGIGLRATPGAVGLAAAPVKLSSSTPSSLLTNPLLLPMLLIGGLLFAALRYSKPEEKKM